jgi:apolipoprotein N-acyltransferase
MTDPGITATFIITGVATAALGPVLGPYALIVFAAAVGGLLALTRIKTATRMEGFWFILVGIFLALVFTAPAVWLLESQTHIPGSIALMPMAFVIAAGRNHILTLMDRGVSFLTSLFPKKEGGQ